MTLRFLYGILGSVVLHVLLVIFAPDVVLPKMSMPEYKKHQVSFVNRYLQLPKELIHEPVPEISVPKYIPMVKKPIMPSRPILSDPNAMPKIKLPKLPVRPILAKVEQVPPVAPPKMPLRPVSPKYVPRIRLPEYPDEIVFQRSFPDIPFPKRKSGTKKLKNKNRIDMTRLESKSEIVTSPKVKFSDLFISKKAKSILSRDNFKPDIRKRIMNNKDITLEKKDSFNEDVNVSSKEIDIDKYLKKSRNESKRNNILIVDSPLRKEMDKRTRSLLFSPPLPKINSLQMPVTVVLKFWVLSDGSVGRIIVERKGNASLEVSAINHLKRWRFNSLALDYKSSEQWGIVAYRFLVN